MKWEPVAAMIGLLALGIWLVISTSPADIHGIPTRAGSHTREFRVALERGVLEVVPAGVDGPSATFRVLLKNGHASGVMTEGEFKNLYGERAYAEAIEPGNWLFRLLNITSWSSLAWIAVGFAGQGAFFGRMLVQWVVSEKERKSTIPPIFWWLSLFGGVALFAYFVWRQDIVGVLGQTSGVVIYARNIRLIRKQRRREERAAAQAGVQTV